MLLQNENWGTTFFGAPGIHVYRQCALADDTTIATNAETEQRHFAVRHRMQILSVNINHKRSSIK